MYTTIVVHLLLVAIFVIVIYSNKYLFYYDKGTVKHGFTVYYKNCFYGIPFDTKIFKYLRVTKYWYDGVLKFPSALYYYCIKRKPINLYSEELQNINQASKRYYAHSANTVSFVMIFLYFMITFFYLVK